MIHNHVSVWKHKVFFLHFGTILPSMSFANDCHNNNAKKMSKIANKSSEESDLPGR